MESPALTLPHCKACELEDFTSAELRELIRAAFATHMQRFGPDFPTGVEFRKYWEVAMTLRALNAFGAVRPDSELLGIGAGAEATLFWLTNHVRRVFATDLYIVEDTTWGTQTPPGMLMDPGQFASGPWNPRRLVVQHMDALDLRYEDATFDGVFSSSSIEHFGDHDAVRAALREMHRVLKPGAVAALSTEYRTDGELASLPGSLLFSAAELESVLLDEAVADVQAGREWRFPHLVLHHGLGVTWTSVHVVLRKPSG